MDINAFVTTDKGQELINAGTWVGDLDEAPGVELLVKGLSADDVDKYRKKIIAEQLARNKNKPLTDEQQSVIGRMVLAHAVLQDWRGFTDGGKPLKFDRDLAVKWIMGNQGVKLASLVLSAARRLDDEANEFAEALKKT